MISKKVEESLKNSSWIRKMFEEGARLKAIYGDENVYDFSIGNPYFEPPVSVVENLKKLVNNDYKGLHRYMSNAGYDDVRAKVANAVSENADSPITHENVIMTVGAAGGINVCLKALLNEGEEVIAFAPYFVEYGFYVGNHGGKLVVCDTDKSTFFPDLKTFEKVINEKTKAIIINSPNNPTGVIYSAELLREMSSIIEKKEKEFGTDIYLISDEPYSVIRYDNIELPNVFNIFKNSIIANSFSKSLGLAGERIGYLAINSKIEHAELLVNALIVANRTSVKETVDVNEYLIRRNKFYDILTEVGFECIKPQGAFYLFPKAPIDNDVEFVMKAKEFNILAVPGSGFGCPGYFRLSYCIGMDTIENSKEAWQKLAKFYKMY